MTNYRVRTYSSGIKYDDLLGGEEVKVSRVNVRVANGLSIKRGELISRGADGYYRGVRSSNDTKLLAISAMDITAEDNRVILAYYTGIFNRSKIILGEGLEIGEFEEKMKEQGLYLTEIEEISEWEPINYGSSTGEEETTGSDVVGSEVQ